MIGPDGIERRQVRTSTRKLGTIVGEVTVERRIYQAPGWSVESLAPMDAVLNLPAERYSHHVRRVVAEQASRSSFEEVVEFLAKHTGADVPKRQVEELSQRAAQDFDAFYAERSIVAEATDDLLVLSFDGKGIAMRHEDLREATQKAAEATPRRLATRLTSGEKANCKRMATVYSIAPWRRTAADVLHPCARPTSRPTVHDRRASRNTSRHQSPRDPSLLRPVGAALVFTPSHPAVSGRPRTVRTARFAPIAGSGRLGSMDAVGAYTAERAAALSGVPKSTIHWWARHDVLVPSVSAKKIMLWSYADLMGLRVIYWLRQRKTTTLGVEIPRTSMAAVRRALKELRAVDTSVWNEGRPSLLVDETGELYLKAGGSARTVGGQLLVSEDILDLIAPFCTKEGTRGPDLVAPRPELRILPGKLSGSPHVARTRVETRALSALALDGFDVTAIQQLYPFVSSPQIEQAIDLERQLDDNLHKRVA